MAGVPVRVLIADDQRMASRTVAALASTDGFEPVGLAADAAEASELAAAERPDVVLAYARLRGGGVPAVRGVLAASPDTRVLVHSCASDQAPVIAMLRAGATGYVGRSAPPEKLASALVSVAAGEPVFDDVVNHEERAMKQARILGVMQGDDLGIVFQPIVALEDRSVVGYEALSRFRCEPERGPDKWFAEAHQVGLGTELELWAVRRACERSAALPDDGFMALNVSPRTAERADLLGVLAAAQVDHVVLEVTEHERVEDYPRLRIAIRRVRELGARLAIDDAGAGFASWRHVLELDADLIKLDGALTKAVDLDPRRRSLAAALVDFGHEAGAAVLAEQIESEPQLAELQRLGIRYGQGYHLGRPQPNPVAA